MKVLVACEFSGTVRDAFTRAGHDAMSCDLLDTESPGPHYKGDVRDVLDGGWDLMVAHPPCTHLAVSGARWFSRPGKLEAQGEAIEFVRLLMDAPIPRIAIENPRSIISSRIRPADQCIQPWQFGVPENKGICLWLKNLPKLVPTEIVPKEFRKDTVWKMPQTADRWKKRSVFFPGVADAMADQWGKV